MPNFAKSLNARVQVGVPLSLLLLAIDAAALAAQPIGDVRPDDHPSETSVGSSPTKPESPSASTSGSKLAPSEGNEIVVTAPRIARGAARVDADFEIDATEFEIYAADTIGGLMEALSPRTGSTQPVILVNGERTPEGGGISSYPPEAIERIQVLPPEAAAAYGYPPGQQLINIILKRSFASWTVQADASGPTQGGRRQYNANVSRVFIAGNNRWSFDLRAGAEDMLREDRRDIPAPPSLSGFAGNIRSAVSGAEIDPALSAAAGVPVLSAAVPEGHGGALLLSDFLAGANAPLVAQQAHYRSILPATRALGLTASLVRPLGAFQSSVQLGVDYRDSRGLIGLSTASLLLPADNIYSPFAGDVRIERAWAAALPSRQSNLSLTAGFSLNGEVAGWRAGFGGGFAYGNARSRSSRGVDGTALQAAVDGGTVNPFLLPLLVLEDDTSRTKTQSASFNMNAMRSVARLPAGSLLVALGGEASASRTDTRFEDGRPVLRQRRESISGRFSMLIPVTNVESGPVPALGGLMLQLSAGGDAASGGALRHQYSYGLSWSPTTGVNMSAAAVRVNTPPDAGLLAAPLSETPNVRVYDFVAGERVDVTRIDGGNPDLRAAALASFTMQIRLRPSFVEGLSFVGQYNHSDTQDGVGQLPAPTVAVEAAFPERITRGADGKLLRIDARPINIARVTTKKWKSNLSLMLPLGGGDAVTALTGQAGAEPNVDDEAAGQHGRRAGRGGGASLLVSLEHDWNLSDRALLRRGLAPLDRLAGDGGVSVPKHSVSASLKLNIKDIGIGIDARWLGSSVARSDGVDRVPGTRLGFSSKTEVGLRLFGTISQLSGGLEPVSWAKGLRLSLDVDNLFDARVRVRDQYGAVPLGFTRDELDPLGRTVKLSLRKML